MTALRRPKQTEDTNSMMLLCWPNVYDTGPILFQHWINVQWVSVRRWWYEHVKCRILNTCWISGVPRGTCLSQNCVMSGDPVSASGQLYNNIFERGIFIRNHMYTFSLLFMPGSITTHKIKKKDISVGLTTVWVMCLTSVLFMPKLMEHVTDQVHDNILNVYII